MKSAVCCPSSKIGKFSCLLSHLSLDRLSDWERWNHWNAESDSHFTRLSQIIKKTFKLDLYIIFQKKVDANPDFSFDFEDIWWRSLMLQSGEVWVPIFEIIRTELFAVRRCSPTEGIPELNQLTLRGRPSLGVNSREAIIEQESLHLTHRESVSSLWNVTPAEIASAEEPQSAEERRELGPEVGGEQEAGDGGEGSPEQALGQAGQTQQLLLGEESEVWGVSSSEDPATQEEDSDPHVPLPQQVRAVPSLHSFYHLQEGRQPALRPGPGHQRQEYFVIYKDWELSSSFESQSSWCEISNKWQKFSV